MLHTFSRIRYNKIIRGVLITKSVNYQKSGCERIYELLLFDPIAKPIVSSAAGLAQWVDLLGKIVLVLFRRSSVLRPTTMTLVRFLQKAGGLLESLG